jgi:glycosyl transferase family 25
MTSISKIDKIYVINLKNDFERRSRIQRHFKDLNIIDYDIFDAIRPTEHMLDNYPNFMKNMSHNIRIGALGCLLSHITIMKEALKKNYSNILIFEDDIQILDTQFANIIESHLNFLDDDFNVLYLGANHKKPATKKITDGIYQCSSSNGTFSYIINKKTMELLTQNYAYKFPIDVQWRKMNININKFYCIIPHLCNIVDTVSSIHNVHTKYQTSILNSQNILTSKFV